MRDLSGRTNQFSQQIRRNVRLVEDSVHAAEREIDEMASKDMNFALQSKQDVEGMMGDVQKVNAEIAAAAQQLAVITGAIGQNVDTAVTTLQFKDPMAQLLGHVAGRIDALEAVCAKMGALARDLSAVDAGAKTGESRAQRLRAPCGELLNMLAQARQGAINPTVLQASMASGGSGI